MDTPRRLAVVLMTETYSTTCRGLDTISNEKMVIRLI
jgi:hypothetical protein